MATPTVSRSRTPEIPQIERVPWSTLGPSFIEQWGRPRGKKEPEHLEVLGPTGCGKTVLIRECLWERVRRRGTSVVMIATKPDDPSVTDYGWPITDSWREVQEHEQVVFWPRTSALGEARERYQEEKVRDLLERLWQPSANTIVFVDEWNWVEDLSPKLKKMLGMYLREGRSLQITNVMGKQRVQGNNRSMHSESQWKFGFKMADEDDTERLAQLFGRKNVWREVINSLDHEAHEFLVQHKLTGETFISWVDSPSSPPVQRTGYMR